MRNGRWLLLALALTPLASCGDDAAAAKGKRARPPQLVGTIPARAEAFTPRLVALGTVTPLQTVAVRPRIDGQLTAILFDEGDTVRRGQPMFRLDDRQARADVAQARAALASARATSVQARNDLDRAEALVGKGFVSKAVLDQRRAVADGAAAAIASAEAAVASAETVLSFLTIRAPVSGRTGELNFRVGANVRPADPLPLVTVNQLSPISVRFLIPPDQIGRVRDAMSARGGLTVTARPQGNIEAAPVATGRLAFLDNNVDPGNGSVAAKAEFANRDAQLWPGAILDIHLPTADTRPYIALPEAAVQIGRDAPFVWTVAGDGKIAMRAVSIVGRAEGKAYVASGLTPGDTVVTDALSKLKPGDRVRTRGGPGRAPQTAASRPAEGTAG